MAKFILKRKTYAATQQVIQQEEQQPVQQPVSTAGQELRSAAISTLAPMAITGAVNMVQGAGKKTKAALIGTALTAGLGYAANKGYLGKTAQRYAGKAINYGKGLVNKFKPATTTQATQIAS